MAFYSKSVNEIGDEIDRSKFSELYDTRGIQNRNVLTDRGSIISQQDSSFGGIYSRFSNPAVYIAKTDTSMESLSDVGPSIIPPLDLNSSGETMPSTDSGAGVSYTIPKTFEASRISHSNAFYNWLSGKKRLRSYEQAKQREIEEEHQRQLEERKKLAEKKYQEWLAKKNQPKVKPSLHQPQTELQEFEEVCQIHDGSESNRKAWEQKKMEEQRRRKEQLLKDRERKRQLEEKRKQQATRAWQNWIAEAPFKPKPVPLNKGFLSLKGTISDIYINPNPWNEPLEVDACD